MNQQIDLPTVNSLAELKQLIYRVYPTNFEDIVREADIFHVTACYLPKNSKSLYVLQINEHTPKSEWDWFVLNCTRTISDVTLYGGEILRCEPHLDCSVQGRADMQTYLLELRNEIRLNKSRDCPGNQEECNSTSCNTPSDHIDNGSSDVVVSTSLVEITHNDANPLLAPPKIPLSHPLITSPKSQTTIFTPARSHELLIPHLESQSQSASNIHASWNDLITKVTTQKLTLASPLVTAAHRLGAQQSQLQPHEQQDQHHLNYKRNFSTDLIEYLRMVRGYQRISIEAGPYLSRQVYRTQYAPKILFLTIYHGKLSSPLDRVLVPRKQQYLEEMIDSLDQDDQSNSSSFAIPAFAMHQLDTTYKLVCKPFRPYPSPYDEIQLKPCAFQRVCPTTTDEHMAQPQLDWSNVLISDIEHQDGWCFYLFRRRT